MLAVLLIAQNPVAAATKGELPIPAATLALMGARDTSPSAPVLIRSYKKESEIEVWKQAKSGRFVFLKTFPICRWSGALGPKTKQGDRQTPEGFYSVGPKQMNPYSHYYLSFDTGYPNAYDRAHGYTGSDVMVHGICSSAGCFAMTDKGIGEIFAIAREALKGGQPAFQFQAFPFRMTAQNMAKYRSDPNIEFWRQLKEGSDRFEATGEELVVNVTAGRYAFAPSQDPANEALASARHLQEKARVAALIAEGSAAVRTVYGGRRPECDLRGSLEQGSPSRRGQPSGSAGFRRHRRDHHPRSGALRPALAGVLPQSRRRLCRRKQSLRKTSRKSFLRRFMRVRFQRPTPPPSRRRPSVTNSGARPRSSRSSQAPCPCCPPFSTIDRERRWPRPQRGSGVD